jgi:Viral coat protein P2 N-terminal domain
MSAQILPLQPFQNVVASGIAICDLSNLFGYTTERVLLRLGGGAFTKSMITAIQLKANGKVIFDSTGPATDSRNQYRGITANAAFITIDFLELRARTKMGMMGGALDTTLGLKNLRLEVTIAGATTPTLAGWAEVSVPQTSPEFANVRPLIARIHRNTQSIGGAGTFLLAVPHLDPNQGGSIFKRIAIFSANMTGGRVERNGIREWDLDNTATNNFNQTEYARAPQASLFMMDFVVDGLQEDRVLDTRAAAGCNIANAYGIFSGAETITIESEVLEPLDVY